MLFAFDRTRRAILLLGGDKSGDWSHWYATNVPIADDRFDEHQATAESGVQREQKTRRRKR